MIQALAAFDVKSGKVRADQGNSGEPEDSLLGRFHYLSTVSGGGYIGSWLSAWRSYDDFHKVRNELIGRPDGPDVEPPEVSWLRAYSNYLTPRVGIGSADAWTAVALYARNLLLNWLVILPVLCLVLFGLKLIAATSVAVARKQNTWWPVGVIGLIGAAALGCRRKPLRRRIVRCAVSRNRTPCRAQDPRRLRTTSVNARSSRTICRGAFSRPSPSRFLCCSMDSLDRQQRSQRRAGHLRDRRRIPLRHRMDRRMACPRLTQGLRPVGRLRSGLWRPHRAWRISVRSPEAHMAARTDFKLSLPIIFGIPWVLMSQLIAEMIFVGLVSYET